MSFMLDKNLDLRKIVIKKLSEPEDLHRNWAIAIVEKYQRLNCMALRCFMWAEGSKMNSWKTPTYSKWALVCSLPGSFPLVNLSLKPKSPPRHWRPWPNHDQELQGRSHQAWRRSEYDYRCQYRYEPCVHRRRRVAFAKVWCHIR